MNDQPTKADLRDRAKRNRAGLGPNSAKVCEGIVGWLARVEPPAEWVLVYEAMSGEVDLAALASDALIGRLALTRTPLTGRILTIHPYDSARETHAYGYSQPIEGASIVDDADIGVVLVPGLAFDREGQRLGWGAGFYDRLLDRFGPDVLVVGVSDGFIVDKIPTEPHDKPMAFLATEAGVMPVPLGPSSG